MRLRICMVAPMIGTTGAGLSSYIQELVPRLCDAGHDITILAADCGYKGGDAGEQVRIDSRARLNVFTINGKVNRRIYRSPEMTQWMLEHSREFDVIDIQGVWTCIAADIADVALKSRIPYVITPHGMMTRWDWAKQLLAKHIFFETRLRRAWRSAAVVRYLSQGELKNSKVPPRSPYAIIPNAIATPEVAHSEPAFDLRKHLDIAEGTQLIVFLGRISEQKGVLELLRAFEIVQSECPKAVLAVAGPIEGRYGDEVRLLASQIAGRTRLHLLGGVFGPYKKALLEAACLFVTLSKNEGLPLAALEALSFGVPTVLTRDSNLPEVETYGAGVITTCDPGEAAGALKTILQDPLRLAAMRLQAKDMVRECFSWDVVLPRLIQLYATVSQTSSADMQDKLDS